MNKNTLFYIYLCYIKAWYIRFFKKKYATEYRNMRTIMKKAHVRTLYLFGIKFMRIYEYEKNRIIFLFGLFPALLITEIDAKTCVYLGCIELWKEKRTGKLQLSDDFAPMEKDLRERQRLFYNIDALKKSQAGAGIPRTAANLLAALMKECDGAYDVIPVRSAIRKTGFFSAFHDARSIVPFLEASGEDGPVRFSAGDILLFPIPDLEGVEAQYHALKFLKKHGVRIYFIVYDLIVLRHPEFFDASLYKEITDWLLYTSEFNGIVAISRASEQEYLCWMRKNVAEIDRKIFTSWFQH